MKNIITWKQFLNEDIDSKKILLGGALVGNLLTSDPAISQNMNNNPVEQSNLALSTGPKVEFNGIRVGESLEITKKKLVEKGFTEIDTVGNLISWEGQINARPCKIYIVSTPKSKLVWKLVVIPEIHTSWSSTKDAVNKYVETLSKKYGAPSNQYFFFKNPYEEGDGREMLALKTDNLVCMYVWDIPGGSILLKISKISTLDLVNYLMSQHVYDMYGVQGGARIEISYEDAKVSKIDSEEKSKM